MPGPASALVPLPQCVCVCVFSFALRAKPVPRIFPTFPLMTYTLPIPDCWNYKEASGHSILQIWHSTLLLNTVVSHTALTNTTPMPSERHVDRVTPTPRKLKQRCWPRPAKSLVAEFSLLWRRTQELLRDQCKRLRFADSGGSSPHRWRMPVPLSHWSSPCDFTVTLINIYRIVFFTDLVRTRLICLEIIVWRFCSELSKSKSKYMFKHCIPKKQMHWHGQSRDVINVLDLGIQCLSPIIPEPYCSKNQVVKEQIKLSHVVIFVSSPTAKAASNKMLSTQTYLPLGLNVAV